ncbi:TlpA disulfide reductase family protein [uncultured Polaribacter sp.]|uniref:TlpA family protein disulfide reductase n=1 Tax=uncultured Polaribacter sp. TaxID=174711 RepID=UPI00260AB6AB|nr:TlpA disulfide reductase family protein [uncultured Polaribacter sp.]
MRKINRILIGITLLVFFSCSEDKPKDYVTISGSIKNVVSDSLVIHGMMIDYKKVIKVNEDGTFSDTLKVTPSQYFLSIKDKEGTVLYLNNGYDLELSVDVEKITESIVFKGNGANENNYLIKKRVLGKHLFSNKNILTYEEEKFNRAIDSAYNEFNNLLIDVKNLDTLLISLEKKEFDVMKHTFKRMYYAEKEIKTGPLAKGNPAPKFIDYKNYDGGEMSLDDLLGKYVYIDIWATWCAPCKKEIPFLKEIEKQYHGKNIEFVSISTDRKKDYQKWRKMVAEKELTGIQLYSKQDSLFPKRIKLLGIPRFLLIDPQGNIVNANAPRPSDEKLIKLFDEIGI